MDFLFFLFPANESPEGKWVRTGDQFSGCVIQVERHGLELAGRIITLPEAMGRAGWIEGDLKWRNIELAGGSWRLQDARKYFDPKTNTVTAVDYRTYFLSIGALDHMRLHTKAGPFFPDQRWVRYKS